MLISALMLILVLGGVVCAYYLAFIVGPTARPDANNLLPYVLDAWQI